MPRPRTLIAVLAAAATTALAPPAGAQTSTLDRRIVATPGGPFEALRTARGERRVVRRAPGVTVNRFRRQARKSLLYFGQLTDSQILDETSPIRLDFLDAAGGDVKDAYRPHDAMATQVFDQVIRSMNAAWQSPVRDRRNRRAEMGLILATGDLADNQQLNEVRWFRQVIDGDRVDPSSGKPVSESNPCPGASADEIARLNADAAARRYTGVADLSDWPANVPIDRFSGFWDPDRAAPAEAPPGAYAGWPRYPGLLDRAQQPFRAQGVRVATRIARGNHDGLLEGVVPASNDLIRGLAPGCVKVFPGDAVDPASLNGDLTRFLPTLNDGATIRRLLEDARRVPPDPARRVIRRREFKRIMGGSTGLRFVEPGENRRSRGTASYYSFTRKNIRFISIDTVAEGGGSNGNLDDPQYRWLRSRLRSAEKNGELTIVFGHHTLETMDNRTADEAAGDCANPGCDEDPRRSTPIHRGTRGKRSIKNLLLNNKTVVAYIAGHVHDNEIRLHRRGRRALWQVATASHIDWPQQSRTLELMDNQDGTLSLFGTILDHRGRATAPPPGPAAGFTPGQLASLARTVAWNDPQRPPKPASGEPENDRRGKRTDRNVELLVDDPRR